MATYIVLTNLTDQGVRTAKDTGKRSDAVKDQAKKFGVTVKEFYWTLGSYDVVGIFEAPDDASMTALGLAIGAGGNVRTQTMRAFSREEMNGVLAKLAQEGPSRRCRVRGLARCAGTSGGVWGLAEGYSMMVGGRVRRRSAAADP